MSNRILLIDDHPLFRLGLAATLLQLDVEVEIVEIGSVPAAVDLLVAQPPFDLILYDWHLRGNGGVQGLLAIRQLAPGTPVVVVSADEDEGIRIAALQLGASDFLSKSAEPATISEVLGLMLRRQPPAAARASPRPAGDREAQFRLSQRQHEVLQRMARGEVNKRIAGHLDIAETTVRAHVSDILRLLQAGNRTEAVVKARRLGLLDFG